MLPSLRVRVACKERWYRPVRLDRSTSADADPCLQERSSKGCYRWCRVLTGSRGSVVVDDNRGDCSCDTGRRKGTRSIMRRAVWLWWKKNGTSVAKPSTDGHDVARRQDCLDTETSGTEDVTMYGQHVFVESCEITERWNTMLIHHRVSHVSFGDSS